MSNKILLLDCSSKLLERLTKQGFDVEAGTLGFATGTKKLLRPIYEYDIFIYNPTTFRVLISPGSMPRIEDKSPEYDLSDMTAHIRRGAVILAFVNNIIGNSRHLNLAYDWIPEMPNIQFTKDYKINTGYIGSDWIKPLVLPNEVKTPSTIKLIPNYSSKVFNEETIFYNNNREALGVECLTDNGVIVVLPTYNSNEDIISIFLNRSIKKLFKNTSSNLIDIFQSPEELLAESQKVVATEAIETLEHQLEIINEESATATRNKIKVISEDETAKLITNYYKLATDQEDSAIFYLYKIIDALKKKFGEKEAKNILKCNKEFNLIGTLANKSYADARHAPYPEEKIVELSTAEIEACFAGATIIIDSYFSSLFPKKPPMAIVESK